MNVTFACSHCHEVQRVELRSDTASIDCAQCRRRIAVPAGSLENGELHRCLVCPSQDLFLRKDFPQRVGVAIVVAGFIASSIAWGYYHQYLTFGILFAVALVDVVLYMVVGDALMCYRCGAMYRGFPQQAEHGRFDLTVHEKHRQLAARLAQPRGAASAATEPHR